VTTRSGKRGVRDESLSSKGRTAAADRKATLLRALGPRLLSGRERHSKQNRFSIRVPPVTASNRLSLWMSKIFIPSSEHC
jgi:hypothetical protein